jgi:excinuclease ABC subunit C
VCTGNVDESEYRKLIDEVCSFLNGNTDKLIENLEEKMYEYSNNLDFEKAAFYRDKIEIVKNISQKQKATSIGGTNADAIAMYSQNSTDCIQVFFIRNGKMLGRENYFIENSENNNKKEVLTDFVKQYYTDASFVPSEILVEFDIDEIDLISEWLTLKKGKKVEIKSPKRGENLKLINLIKQNAKKELQNKELKILKDIKFKNTALVGLKNILNLKDIPHKIEAFDISGFAGNDLVASMVSFVDAKPNKKGYKLFKIKTVDKNDDYSSMREVITRRFTRLKNNEQSFSDKPDVIFVDGGIGHVNCAKSVLNELDIDIPVFGIQKDNNHNTRAIASENGVIEFDKTSESFMLLVNIQDEMHRRAISYYRTISEKRNKRSELENIKGVGEKKRNLILKHLKNVKNASLEEIESVPGIDKKTARNIYEYFRHDEN